MHILASSDLATSVSNISVAVVSTAVVLLIGLVMTAILTKRRASYKKPLFTLIATVVIVATLALSGTAIVLNANSPTGGPVRWEADFQMWACGNQLDLRDPRGVLTDRIGSPVLFERNDGRIHYSGTPIDLPQDASLGTFLRAVGGEINDNSLIFPINNDTGFMGTPDHPEYIEPYIGTNSEGTYVRFLSGQACGDEPASVQVFVYHFDELTDTYNQRKITHPAEYEIRHKDGVPPGDCIIIEFAPEMSRTNHLCQSYQEAT